MNKTIQSKLRIQLVDNDASRKKCYKTSSSKLKRVYRNLVLDSDTDNDEDNTLVTEPPDKLVDDDGNPFDFHLGW